MGETLEAGLSIIPYSLILPIVLSFNVVIYYFIKGLIAKTNIVIKK